MRRLIENLVVPFLLVLVVMCLMASVASACPNCKEAMEKQDPTHGGMVKGYFYSIIFMMSTPYLLLGTFCAVMYYRVRRARLAGKPKPPLAGAATNTKAGTGESTPNSSPNRGFTKASEPIEV